MRRENSTSTMLPTAKPASESARKWGAGSSSQAEVGGKIPRGGSNLLAALEADSNLSGYTVTRRNSFAFMRTRWLSGPSVAGTRKDSLISPPSALRFTSLGGGTAISLSPEI